MTQAGLCDLSFLSESNATYLSSLRLLVRLLKGMPRVQFLLSPRPTIITITKSSPPLLDPLLKAGRGLSHSLIPFKTRRPAVLRLSDGTDPALSLLAKSQVGAWQGPRPPLNLRIEVQGSLPYTSAPSALS